MNDKLQYAEMLEIPVNTCSVTYKPTKKRLFGGKNLLDEVKAKLVKKVNQEGEKPFENSPQNTEILPDEKANLSVVQTENLGEYSAEIQTENGVEFNENYGETTTATVRKISPKSKKKISVIGVQLIVIGALIATIFLTSALLPNSGINAFFTGVFETENLQSGVQVDNRNYKEFTAVLPTQNLDGVTLNDGVMTLNQKGSVYAPCKGKVSKVFEDGNGKITLEITHNDNFKTVFSGIDYAYFTVGSEVFSTIPVGYASLSGATACFIGENGETITGYTLGENGVIWAV